MIAQELITRVQTILEDQTGDVYDADYILSYVPQERDRVFNKLRNTASTQFDEALVQIPGVPAGTPDLSGFMVPGQPLALLLQPSVIEWKIPGQLDIYYQPAEGPLAKQRDVVPLPALDSWSWRQSNIFLSATSVALDLRITGEFLLPPVADANAQLGILANIGVYLVDQVALKIAKTRGSPAWIAGLEADRDESFDDINQALTKFAQRRTDRVGRMNPRNNGPTGIVTR